MESSSWLESFPSDRQRAINELVKGRDSANKLKLFLHESPIGDEEESLPAQDLVLEILTSFTSTLSILNRVDSEEVSQFPASNFTVGSPGWDGRKSEDSGDSSKSSSIVKSRRGCYKRRKTCDSWIRETQDLVDDGYAWRKYGQKVILNAKYPRNYFRCTHKHDQGCQANKQVQRIQEDPPLYRTTYNGNHTCKNAIKANRDLIIDCFNANDDSSILLSFDGSNSNFTKKQDHPFSTSSLLVPTIIKQECKDDVLPDRQDKNSNNQSSSSDVLLSSAYHPDDADVISEVNNSSSSCTMMMMEYLMVPSVDPHFDDDDDVRQYVFDGYP